MKSYNKYSDEHNRESTNGHSDVQPTNTVDPANETRGTREENEYLSDAHSDSLIEDPVRLYLTQMSNFPRISRKQEKEIGRRKDAAKERLRRALLSHYSVLRSVQETLRALQRGELRFDYTVDVSSREAKNVKKDAMRRLQHHLPTLDHLLETIDSEYESVQSEGTEGGGKCTKRETVQN